MLPIACPISVLQGIKKELDKSLWDSGLTLLWASEIFEAELDEPYKLSSNLNHSIIQKERKEFSDWRSNRRYFIDNFCKEY